MKFGALSELSKIKIASSGGIFFPLFGFPPVRFIIQDGGRAIKGLFIACRPNMLALQVTIIFVIILCSMRRVSNTDDPLHNVPFRDRGRVPVE